MHDDNLNVGEAIRTARVARAQGVRAAAGELGVSANNVSLWENGRTFPSVEHHAAVAKYIDVPVAAVRSAWEAWRRGMKSEQVAASNAGAHIADLERRVGDLEESLTAQTEAMRELTEVLEAIPGIEGLLQNLGLDRRGGAATRRPNGAGRSRRRN